MRYWRVRIMNMESASRLKGYCDKYCTDEFDAIYTYDLLLFLMRIRAISATTIWREEV
jgi:hypothetical protein